MGSFAFSVFYSRVGDNEAENCTCKIYTVNKSGI